MTRATHTLGALLVVTRFGGIEVGARSRLCVIFVPSPEANEGERVRTMNSSRRHFRSGLKLFFAAAIVWTSSNATAAEVYVPFEGEKTTWHEGFDRYDFIMDDATGAITPMTAPATEVTSFGIDVS